MFHTISDVQVAAQYHALEAHKPSLTPVVPSHSVPAADPIRPQTVEAAETKAHMLPPENALPSAGSSEAADGWDMDDGLFDDINGTSSLAQSAGDSDHQLDEYVHVDRSDATTPPKHVDPIHSKEDKTENHLPTPAIAPVAAPVPASRAADTATIVPASVVQSAIAASLQASEREQLLGGATDKPEAKDDDAALMRTRALLSAEIERMSAVSTLLSQDHGTLIGTQEQHAAYARESAAALENVRIVKVSCSCKCAVLLDVTCVFEWYLPRLCAGEGAP
jgi:hypothetical protein